MSSYKTWETIRVLIVVMTVVFLHLGFPEIICQSVVCYVHVCLLHVDSTGHSDRVYLKVENMAGGGI